MRRSRAARLVAAVVVLTTPFLVAVATTASAAPARKPAPPGAPAPTTRTQSDSRVGSATTAATAVGALAGVETDENLRCSVQRSGYGQEFYGTWSCGTDIAVDG